MVPCAKFVFQRHSGTSIQPCSTVPRTRTLLLSHVPPCGHMLDSPRFVALAVRLTFSDDNTMSTTLTSMPQILTHAANPAEQNQVRDLQVHEKSGWPLSASKHQDGTTNLGTPAKSLAPPTVWSRPSVSGWPSSWSTMVQHEPWHFGVLPTDFVETAHPMARPGGTALTHAAQGRKQRSPGASSSIALCGDCSDFAHVAVRTDSAKQATADPLFAEMGWKGDFAALTCVARRALLPSCPKLQV